MQLESTLITTSGAQRLVEEMIADYGLDEKAEVVYNEMVSACRSVEFQGMSFYKKSDLQNFIMNTQRSIIERDFNFLSQKRGLCVNRVVDIEEFCLSPEYMAQKGHLRSAIKKKLIELFASDHYIEAVLTGAIGIGKNYFADMALAYLLYKLSCFHNPQLEYDLAPGSSIIFIQQSITQTLAKKVVFDQFAERLKESPYFRKNFAYDSAVKSELRFPKNIYVIPVGGSDTSALGMNVFGGIIDELNFMARVQDSELTRYTGEEEYDQAERAYRALIRRIKSRFMDKGKVPGKLLLVSSVNYPGDFTSRKEAEAEEEKRKQGQTAIFVMKYSQWQALPPDRFTEGVFLVEVGNELKQSRVLKSMEEATDPEDVIEIPIDYKSEFERDINEALRDLAGVATGTRHPFIPYREALQEAQDKYAAITQGKSLFLRQEGVIDTIVGDPEDPEWDLLVDETYLEDCIIDVNSIFACHLDVALSQNAAGLSIGRIVGYQLLPSTKIYNERRKEFIEVTDIRVPIYQIDGMLRILPPTGGEIDLELVRDLVLYLKGKINIRWATMDSYQAPMFYQPFRRARIRSGVLSVDTSIAPYTELKLSIKDNRILLPPHEVMAREIREVEKDTKADKIDHKAGGCFTGDTRVALLDGTNPTFEELTKRFESDELIPLYSMSGEGICVAYGRNSRITKEVDEVLELTLDNWHVIRCTPDHLFLATSGEWIPAMYLTKETSIMPLYRVRTQKGGWSEYERLWCPIKRESLLTHQMVCRQVYGDPISKGYVVHHLDGTKMNNDPLNLKWEHRKIHASKHTGERHRNDPEWVGKLRAGHQFYREAGGDEKSRDNMLKLIREGKINPLRAGRSSGQSNHRIIDAKCVCLEKPISVYDITVDYTSCFALTSGIFVHNSKDCSDAAAGNVYILQQKEASYGRTTTRNRKKGRNRSEQVRRVRLGRGNIHKKIKGRIV